MLAAWHEISPNAVRDAREGEGAGGVAGRSAQGRDVELVVMAPANAGGQPPAMPAKNGRRGSS